MLYTLGTIAIKISEYLGPLFVICHYLVIESDYIYKSYSEHKS